MDENNRCSNVLYKDRSSQRPEMTHTFAVQQREQKAYPKHYQLERIKTEQLAPSRSPKSHFKSAGRKRTTDYYEGLLGSYSETETDRSGGGWVLSYDFERDIGSDKLQEQYDKLDDTGCSSKRGFSWISEWSFQIRNFWNEYGILFAIWVIAHTLQYIYHWSYYRFNSNYSNMRSILGEGFPLARAAAFCLNLDSSIILLTMCRKTLGRLRRIPFIRRLLPLQGQIFWHKWIAWHIIFFTGLHMVSHTSNYIHYLLADLPLNNSVWGPLWTGMLAFLALLIIALTAFNVTIRQKNYELFYYTHHLFLVFYGVLLFHGSFCLLKSNHGECIQPAFWKYLLFPIGLYAIERFHREVDGRRRVNLLKSEQLPGDVMALQFDKPSVGNKFKPGQFVYLNCPEVSHLQWHPFTLTSTSEEKHMSVHFHAKGNWTRAVRDKLAQSATQPVLRSAPKIYVDGPYDAVSDDVLSYDMAVMVGTGIGVTPFASWLKTFRYRVHSQPGLKRLKKVYFIWICRDLSSFKWFVELLESIQQDAKCRKLIDISLYATIAPQEKRQTLSLLNECQLPLKFGRPNMREILKNAHYEARRMIYPRNKPREIGVFCCGPQALNRDIEVLCKDLSVAEVNLVYNREF